MPRDLVVKKNSRSITIRPYNTPHEYYIITIEDLDGYNHFVDATTPYLYDAYNSYKRNNEHWKAMYGIAQETADYICSVDCNLNHNRPIGEPLTYDFDDGRIVTVHHVNVWEVQSFYPPEIVNAPTISKKIVSWWYFWDNRTLLTNGKTTSKGIVVREGK